MAGAMLLPLSHDRMTVRRMPVVTIVLVLVTIAAHVVITLLERGATPAAMEALVEARTLYITRPSLGVCKPLAGLLAPEEIAEAKSAPLADVAERLDALAGDDTRRESAEQYEQACARLDRAMSALPTQRLGYVPARANVLGLFTHVFVHGDIWHVVGNMWFLFLCGLALEDRWGRLAFPVYYVVAGVVAAGAHHLAKPESTAVLIGASGAVAGAMGAFLVLYATTRIKFVAIVGVRFVTFDAPAYVMLPLWAAIEIAYGALVDGTGTAHWAHVGGFAFGLASAGALRAFGLDRKLDDAVERAAVLGDDPRVDAARAMVASGDAEKAVVLLQGLAKEKPESVHVWEALQEAARAHGDHATAAEAERQMALAAELRGRPSATARATSVIPSATPVGSSSRISKPSQAARARASSPSGSTPTAPAAVADDGAAPFFPAPPKK